MIWTYKQPTEVQFGVSARREQQPAERIDSFIVQAFALEIRLHKDGNQIVLRVFSSRGHDRRKIGSKFIPGLERRRKYRQPAAA